MPKKFVGENSKAVAAKARKTAVKEQQQVEKKKQLEDQSWQDADKHVQKKQQKKEEQDRKKQEAADRKAESKVLLEQEMSSIKKPVPKVAPPAKVTRAQVSANLASTSVVKKEKEKVETHLDLPLEENLNRIVIDGEEARTVTEAISLLSSKQQDSDKHPEKRMKAAYTAFEDRRLKVLKEELPTLRLSQLKQMIFKEWQKSPENPLNNDE